MYRGKSRTMIGYGVVLSTISQKDEKNIVGQHQLIQGHNKDGVQRC